VLREGGNTVKLFLAPKGSGRRVKFFVGGKKGRKTGDGEKKIEDAMRKETPL